MQVESAKNLKSLARRTGPQVLFVGCALGLVVASGSDRQPSDPTQPITWHVSEAWFNSSRRYDPPAETLTIASYNIHSGKGRDGRRDLTRIAADLKGVDFAGLYEVRSGFLSLLVPNQAVELSDKLHMRSAFLATERHWWHDHFGNALLAEEPIQHLQRIPLIGTRGKAFRQAVLVDVPLQGETVHIVMVHVDSERDREQQLAAVIRLFLSLETPAVLMGDLNTRQNDPQLAALLARDGVESVIHARLGENAPTNNIDWIITRGLECVRAEYLETGASDHPVVKAELRLPDASAKRR